MEDFTPITSQEALDAVLKDRLNRQNEKHLREMNEKLAGFDETKTKLAESSQLLSEKENQIAIYERNSVKNNIAHEFGLPSELAERLTGDNEEELRKDAEILKGLIGASKVPPLAKGQIITDQNSKENALREMSEALKF